MKVTFVLGNSRDVPVEATAGQSFMEIARDAGLPVEGTCGGQMACCTCHMILDREDYQRLDPPTDEEAGMLDLADGLTATSRLGCQIRLNAETDGMIVRLPR